MLETSENAMYSKKLRSFLIGGITSTSKKPKTDLISRVAFTYPSFQMAKNQFLDFHDKF